MTEPKYILTESLWERLIRTKIPYDLYEELRSLKPVEPVAIAEGRELYWISSKKPADDEKDMFLFPLEN